MKAARIRDYGPANTIEIVEIDKPTLQAGQVLIEVYAASINPFDTTVREGYLRDSMPLKFPLTLGGDLAGVVKVVSEGVSNVSVGDKVYGQASVVAGNSGAFAEFASTTAIQVAPAPGNLDFNQSAALPLVGVSALMALTEHINLLAGQKIFIHGGSGGIGSVAIQLAKHLGAYVATTATSDGIDYVKKLGADEVIDYKVYDFTKSLQAFDAVFDTVGREDFAKTLEVLKPGGIAVSMIAPVDEAKAQKLRVKALTQTTRVTADRLNTLRDLVEKGVIVPQVDKILPLEQVAQAFEARESGQVKGKVVVEIKQV